jgi:hypothetical protein
MPRRRAFLGSWSGWLWCVWRRARLALASAAVIPVAAGDELSTDEAVDSVEDDVAVAVATRSSPTYLRSRRRAVLRAPTVDTEEDDEELMTLVVLALALWLLAEGRRLRATSSGRAPRSCAMGWRGRGQARRATRVVAPRWSPLGLIVAV